MKTGFLAGLIVLLFSSGACADTMVWDTAGNNQFGKLDLDNGSFSLLSDFGFTAAGLGEIGDTVYTAIEGGKSLYTVNNSGTLSLVGTSSAAITYYAFGSTNAGLYMVDTVGGLWTIDPHTGVLSLVGSTHLLMGSNTVGVSSGSNTLYLSLGANVYTIDTATGASTYIGNTGATDIGALVQFGRTLFGTSVVLSDSIYKFDVAAGTASFVTNSSAPDYAYGLAPIIPEPATFVMLGLGGGMLAFFGLKKKASRLRLLSLPAVRR